MREDGRRANEACEATADEKPAALVKRRRVSSHEAAACGDPGSADETKAGTGGSDGQEGPLEGPATAGGGPEIKASAASTEPLE